MKEQFLNFLRSKAGYPYIYGDEGKVGYDCSGLIRSGLREIKHPDLPSWDFRARDIPLIFKKYAVPFDKAKVGSLVLYGSPICHVCAILTKIGTEFITFIGANGGNSRCRTVEESAEMRAFVSIKGLDYRERDRQSTCYDLFPGEE